MLDIDLSPLQGLLPQWLWLLTAIAVLLLGTYFRSIYLPPRFTLVETKGRSEGTPFEARLVFKNIGKLPAYDVWANVHNMSITIDNNTIGNLSLIENGKPTKRVDAGETIEVPIIPQTGIASPDALISECKYELELTHRMRLFPICKCNLSRSWGIELRMFKDGSFIWQHLNY